MHLNLGLFQHSVFGLSRNNVTPVQRPVQIVSRVGPCSQAGGLKQRSRVSRIQGEGRIASSSAESLLLDDNSGSGSGDSGAGDNTGGGGGGDGNEPQGSPDPAVTALLLAAGRSLQTLPAEFAAAVQSGKVSVDIMQRYLDLEGKFLVGFLMSIAGFQERLMADPGFMAKVGIEVGIGVCTKLSAEYAKRQDHFMSEIDFVAANLLMAVIADFMLVWLPAPTLSYKVGAIASVNPLLRLFAGCPDNAFQKVQPGMAPFSVAQRAGAVARNGLKLLGVGMGASFIGVAVTNLLLGARMIIDPSFSPMNKQQNLLQTSAAYGVYMATSSNVRYQILAGIVEERGIETVFKGQYGLTTALSLVVRTANTFLGSLLWVDFVRLLGMQSSGAH